MMNSIFSYILLFLVGATGYFVLLKVMTTDFSSKRKRLSSILQEEQERESNFFVSWLEEKGVLDYINPSYIMDEARKNGVILTKQSYISTFIGGTVIGVIIFIIYFQPFLYLIPLSIIGGVVATTVRLNNIKKAYTTTLDSKLSIYMSSLATSYATFNNPSDALKTVIPTLESPVKEDVEKAYLHMSDGKGVKYSFSHMNSSYPQKAVRLFHDQLDVLVKTGSRDTSKIRTVAYKMKKKETFKRKLQTAHKQQFKIWRMFVVLTLSVPFLFIFASFDNYITVMTNPISSIVYALVFLMILVVYRKLESLEMYDPTEDVSLNK